jgi:hypothetical protein
MVKFFENPDNRFDTEMRLKALEEGEEKHKIKTSEEDRAGVPSYDESVVSDWIRNRTEIPEDMIKGRSIFEVKMTKRPETIYTAEYLKLKELGVDNLRILLDGVEEKSREGRGLFSKGDLLMGYAIDRQTLESLQSINHDTVAYELAIKISEKIRESGNHKLIDTDDILARIIKGFVYLEVPGFKTPIVKLFLGLEKMGNKVLDEDILKISNHIKNEGKLLPISSEFDSL